MQGAIEEKVPADRVDEVRTKLAGLRGHFAEAQARLRTAMEQAEKGPIGVHAQLETRFEKARAAAAKQREAAAASALALPECVAALPPPPKIELLDADSLGHRLLTELGILARPAAPPTVDPGSITDDLPAMDEQWPGIEALTLPLLPERASAAAEMSAQRAALLKPNLAMNAYLASLLDVKRFADIGALLAVELPVREAVWWASLCIQQSFGSKAKPGRNRCISRRRRVGPGSNRLVPARGASRADRGSAAMIRAVAWRWQRDSRSWPLPPREPCRRRNTCFEPSSSPHAGRVSWSPLLTSAFVSPRLSLPGRSWSRRRAMWGAGRPKHFSLLPPIRAMVIIWANVS